MEQMQSENDILNILCKDGNQVAGLALDIGEAMLMTGAGSTRVEDSIHRICTAYGAECVDVFSITSLIILTIRMGKDSEVTQTRRVKSYYIDLDKLELLNALSRQLCNHQTDVLEARKLVSETMKDRPSYFYKMQLGYIITGFSFAIFFGGSILDGLFAGIISYVLFFIDWFLKKKSKNKIVYVFLVSVFVGSLSTLCRVIPATIHMDKVMIGIIMLLIPGTHLMNSVKDMLCGETMTGMMRLIESILTAVAIATGFAVATIAFGGLIQ